MVNKAVILVAGYEVKLAPYTDNMHQCLFNLGERTVLEDMLLKLASCKLNEVILVVGHKAKCIKEKIGDSFAGLKISYIENTRYNQTRTASSFYLTKDYLDEDFLLIDGDMIVEESFIKALIDDKRKNLIAVDFSNNDTNKKIAEVHVLGNRIVNIAQVEEKSDNEYSARSLGIGKFDKIFLNKMFIEIEKSDKKDSMIYEEAINNLLEENQVEFFNSRKYNWFEIDSISEFEKAKKIYGDTTDLKKKAIEFGAYDAYIMLPSEMIFDDRAILQCCNCKNYGIKKTCPPLDINIKFKDLFLKYKKGLFVLVKADCSEDFEKARRESTNNLHKILLQLEKVAFTQDNYYTTSFIGGSCKLCPQGCAKDSCRNPAMSRIPVEATGVDVVATMKKFGLNLTFPAKDEIYRIGLLLIG